MKAGTGQKKALFIIDVQPQTLSAEMGGVVQSIMCHIQDTDYDAYVEAIYFADEKSMFYKQEGFLLPADKAGGTSPEIVEALEKKTAPKFFLNKNVRSCFQSGYESELISFLRKYEIDEAHFCGFDINDCVLASAYGAIDRGFYTYVLEDLCHHSAGNEALKTAALVVFRAQKMSASANEVIVRSAA